VTAEAFASEARICSYVDPAAHAIFAEQLESIPPELR
jgi:hypothetical protein